MMLAKQCNTIFCVMVALSMAGPYALCQQSAGSEALARRVQETRRWDQRLERLQELKSRPLASVEKADDVFSLLSSENQLIKEAYLAKMNLAEGFSDPYYSELLWYAVEVYQETKVPRHFEILVTSSYGINSKVSSVLAQDAASHVEFLVDTINAHEVDVTRGRLLWMLFRARDSQGISKKQGEQVLSIGLECLNDPSAYVRAHAINELSRVKTQNVRARLLDARRTPQTDQFVRSQKELVELDMAIASFGP
jgi:hypothetical protein